MKNEKMKKMKNKKIKNKNIKQKNRKISTSIHFKSSTHFNQFQHTSINFNLFSTILF